jgi:hypothetical protein
MPRDEFLELLRSWERATVESMSSSAVTELEVRAELLALSDAIAAQDGTLERKGPKAKNPVEPPKIANSRA